MAAKTNPFRSEGNSRTPGGGGSNSGKGPEKKKADPAGKGAKQPSPPPPSQPGKISPSRSPSPSSPSPSSAAAVTKKPKPKAITISKPLQITLLDQGETEAAEEPKWGTFCNHLDGEWIGQYAAYTPWEGLPEPCWLDGNDKYVNWVYSRALERRGEDEGGEDVLVRKIGRAVTLDGVKWLPIPPEGLEGGSGQVDVEALTFNKEGVVVFNGGSYSAGPDYVGPPQFKMLIEEPEEEEEDKERSEDEAIRKRAKTWALKEQGLLDDDDDEEERTEAPTLTSIMEQSLVDWGNRVRMRVKATVRIGHTDEGEVDLTVLRLILFRETWAGTIRESSASASSWNGSSPSSALSGAESAVSSSSPSAADALATPNRAEAVKASLMAQPRPKFETEIESCHCTNLPRPTIDQACGEWSCFTISAVGIEGPKIIPRSSISEQIQTKVDHPALDVDQVGGDGMKLEGTPEGELIEEQEVTWIYSSTGDKQLWELPDSNDKGEGEDEGEDEGGALWLPGGVIVTFRMISMDQEEEDEEDERGSPVKNGKHSLLSEIEEKGDKLPRGLCFGLTWLQEGGQCLQIERFYDEKGVLREVRQMTGVKGRYKGGSM